jgi:hypothetical protein
LAMGILEAFQYTRALWNSLLFMEVEKALWKT